MSEQNKHEKTTKVNEGITRREVLCLIGAGAILALLPGCGGGGSQTTPPTPQNSYLIATNPADPLLLRVRATTGQTIDYFGIRDAQKKVASIDHIQIRGTGSQPLRYVLQTDGRPINMTGTTGAVYEISWLSKTKAAITIITPDGANQVSTTVDLSNSQTAKADREAVPAPHLSTDTIVRSNQKPTIRFIPSLRSPSRLATSAADGNVAIRVSSCGFPVDFPLQVYVEVATSTSQFLAEFPAAFIGGGLFRASIPQSHAPDPPVAVFDFCSSLGEALGKVCDFEEIIPLFQIAIQQVLAATILEIALVTALSAEITTLLAGLATACAVLGSSPKGGGGPNLLEGICSATKQLYETVFREYSKIKLTPRVVALPTNAFGQSVFVEGDKAFPLLTVNLGGKTTVRSLKLNPVSPVAQQGYMGTADVFCLPAGTVVTLSIVGTDGYNDSVSTTINSAQKSGTFALSVPGAEASGIEDVVTVTVKPPDSSSITLTASLIFR